MSNVALLSIVCARLILSRHHRRNEDEFGIDRRKKTSHSSWKRVLFLRL